MVARVGWGELVGCVKYYLQRINVGELVTTQPRNQTITLLKADFFGVRLKKKPKSSRKKENIHLCQSQH